MKLSDLAARYIRRLGPIITPDMLPGDDGANINGPSLIKVPPWIHSPLGRYYLYSPITAAATYGLPMQIP
jgi:hypothetical protein